MTISVLIVIQLSNMRRNFWLIILAGFFLVIVYLFVPILPLTFPPQEQFRADPDIREALASVAKEWGASQDDLYVFAMEYLHFGDKRVAIIDPESLASAKVWFSSPRPVRGQPTSGLPSSESRFHLLSQYIPQGTFERVTARNFFVREWSKTNKAIIVHIKTGIPFGEIRAISLTWGELRVPTLLTYPLFLYAIHIDY